MKIGFNDMTGKPIEVGHIVAVRYVWNSYVGEASLRGLLATGYQCFGFFGPHRFQQEHTKQILGHVDHNHPDYNAEVHNWYGWIGGECPLKIRVYETSEFQN